MCNQTIWTILQEKYNNFNDKSVSDFKKFNINLSYNITEGFIIANKNASVYTNYLHFSVWFSKQNKNDTFNQVYKAVYLCIHIASTKYMYSRYLIERFPW